MLRRREFNLPSRLTPTLVALPSTETSHLSYISALSTVLRGKTWPLQGRGQIHHQAKDSATRAFYSGDMASTIYSNLRKQSRKSDEARIENIAGGVDIWC